MKAALFKNLLIVFFFLQAVAYGSDDTGWRIENNTQKSTLTVYKGPDPFFLIPYKGKDIYPVENSHRIPTFNQNGFMEIHADKLTGLFLSAALNAKDILDVGCAFGYWTKRALDLNPSLNATLVDPSKNHLSIAWENLIPESPQSLRSESKGNLTHQQIATYSGHRYDPQCTVTTICGGIEIPGFLNNDSADIALMSDVAAYLNPQTLALALENIHDALRDNGKLFLKIRTPQSHYVSEGYLTSVLYFLGSYFLKDPGYFRFFHVLSPYQPQSFPGSAFFISKESIMTYIKESGFECEDCFDMTRYADKDSIGLVATKKPRRMKSHLHKEEVFDISLPGDSLSGLLQFPMLLKEIKKLIFFNNPQN